MQLLPRGADRALLESVEQANIDGIDAQGMGDIVHVRFVSEADLRRPEASHRAGHGFVRVDHKRFRLQVLDVVGSGGKDAGLPQRRLAPGAVRASIEYQANLTAQNL